MSEDVPNLSADVLSPPTGKLSQVRRIGEGGSAEVWAARWRDRDVAMKVAKATAFDDERDKERFLDEARRLARIDHPGVVKVLDTGELADGRPYLLMELLEGESLADRIARAPIRIEEAITLFSQLADAVDALHDEGLIHRDLKPGNVFLPRGEARAVLLDLGIAKDIDASASTLTQAGVIRGTPAVMAPERFFGTPASVASDIYELAVVLYSMLVGRLPWDNPTNVEARLFPRLPDELQVDLPAPLVDVLMAALSTRPERRPARAGDLARDVQRAIESDRVIERDGTERVAPKCDPPPNPDTPHGATISAGRSLPPTKGTRRASRSWWIAGAVALLGIGVAVAQSSLWHSGVPKDNPPSVVAGQPELAASDSIDVPSSTTDAATSITSSASAPPAASVSPLPTPSWALPRRTRHQDLAWCNQIVDALCDPELIAVNANAKAACAKETANLKRIEGGPRSAWAAANVACRDRHGAVQGIVNLETSGRRDEVMDTMRRSAASAAAAFPSPPRDTTLEAWLQRLPSCLAYIDLYCSPAVRARRGDFGCHAARNAAYVMARNAAKVGEDSIPGHERTCRRMLEQDRATLMTENELNDTLHPPAAASSGSSAP